MYYMIPCTYSYAFLTVVVIPTKPHPNAQNSSYNTHAKLQLLKEVRGISEHGASYKNPFCFIICVLESMLRGE